MSRGKGKYHKNFWDVVDNFLRGLINRGLFPLLLASIIVVILIIRMSQEDATKFAFRILDLVETSGFLGWIASILIILLWFISMRWQRRIITDEMNRIATERDKWQARALGDDNIKSTEE